ncbi:hypothetical protein B0A55_09310 [Friedmanniomyces simplex]|uniref:Endonuclease/exonuclease/phosphatase domain-containing protein n=1 Tax=Friedmanniomyces simplex TaxID=329884 RepID=A0A4U0WN40_9PEZI|nr:hypothetical protein B0A55_09310 [Friedmanniomyces simplex]
MKAPIAMEERAMKAEDRAVKNAERAVKTEEALLAIANQLSNVKLDLDSLKHEMAAMIREQVNTVVQEQVPTIVQEQEAAIMQDQMSKMPITTSQPSDLRALSMGTTPSSITDTIYRAVDTSRVEEHEKGKVDPGTIRQAIEKEMRGTDGQGDWRNEEEMGPVKEAALKSAVAGVRVLRDQLFPVKVDNANRTAVLDENGELRAEVYEMLEKENEVKIAKVAWLSRKDTAKAKVADSEYAMVRKDIEAEQMPVASADFTAAVLRLPDRPVLVVSVYVKGNDGEALLLAMNDLRRLIQKIRGGVGTRTDVILAGDFDRHDHLWEGEHILPVI